MLRCILVIVLVAPIPAKALADDWPALGRDRTRNSVSRERKATLDWQVLGGEVRAGEEDPGKRAQENRNIRWTADLQARSFGSPVVSQGLVWIGTVFGTFQGDRRPGGSLRCFRESDGAPVYERRSEPLPLRINDTSWLGLGGSPLVEGENLWYLTNRCEVVCLDIGPLLRSTGPPRERWIVDLIKEFGVFPRTLVMGPPRQCSIPPSYGERIFVTTSNGVDESFTKVPAPEAPALVCLDKNNGKTMWTDHSPGGNIHVSEASSPLVADIGGRGQVIVSQGDGWLRSFEPATGRRLWEFDLNRKESTLGGVAGDRNYSWSCPVLYDGHIYVTTGQGVENGEGPGRLVCVDPTKSGDISAELAVDRDGKPLPQRRVAAVIAKDGERAIPNPNSGLIWELDASHADYERQFHRSITSVAIDEGLVIAADFSGIVQCLDARTGKWHWSYDTLAACWSNPLVVSGHVLLMDEDGDVTVLDLSADPKVALREGKAPIVNMHGSISSSPVFANGTLYITTDKLYAIGPGREPRVAKALFVPTPEGVVAEMLRVAKVTEKDLLVDLGSGDGRILIAAAKTGARALGYEIDRQLVDYSRDKVKQAQLEKLVTIEEQDFFQADLKDVTVVAAFLYPAVLEKLKPQFATLKPGTRVVAHTFAIPDAEPDETVEYKLRGSGEYRIYLYKMPLRPTAKKTP